MAQVFTLNKQIPMKRFLLLLSMASALFFSCERANDDSPIATETKSRLTAFTEMPSRTTLGSDYSVLWSQNDQIAVLGTMNDGSNGDIALYTLVEGAGSNKGVFEGELPATFDLYSALYPLNMYEAATKSGQFLLLLPTDNAIFTERGFVDGANPMYGCGAKDSGLKFQNLCGIVEFQIKGKGTISSIVIESANQPLSGYFLVQGGEPILYGVNGYEQYTSISATVSPAIELSESTARSLYAILPPATYSNLTISTIDTDGNTTTRTASNDIVVARSHIVRVSEFTHTTDNGGDGGDGGDDDGNSNVEDPQEKPDIDW